MSECSCPYISVGWTVTGQRCWSEDCAEHGVGSEYFRNMRPVPYGLADCLEMTREEWLAIRAEEDRSAWLPEDWEDQAQ